MKVIIRITVSFLLSFLHRARLWAVIFGMLCNAGHAKKLRSKYVCSWNFSETDFTMADKTCLDRLRVPSICTAVSRPHSAQYCEEPCLNSSSCKDLHVLVPATTYSTKSITSLSKESIQSDNSLPSVISPEQFFFVRVCVFKAVYNTEVVQSLDDCVM